MDGYIGIDVGGTNIVCGAVQADGTVLKTAKEPTEAALGAAHVLDKIAALAVKVSEEAGATFHTAAVGAGMPGLVDPFAGVSLNSSNLGWRNVHVVQELERRLGLPVVIDNDVRNYIYGEAVYGAGKSADTVLGLTVGTGIAAAIVQRGQLFYGFKQLNGELGHGPMEGVDAPCGCGMRGCLESVASASGMLREAKRRIGEGSRSVLSEWFPGDGLPGLAAADLSKAYDAGDELATEIIRRAGTLIGIALVPAIHMISPDVVVIGGGGAWAGDRLLEPIREQLHAKLLPDFRDHLRVVAAEQIEDAGVIGSAMAAKKRTKQP